MQKSNRLGTSKIVIASAFLLGIMFASPNIGNFRSELSGATTQMAGVSIGYQAFWDDFKRNLILEFSTRIDTSNEAAGRDDFAVGFQLQQKVQQLKH